MTVGNRMKKVTLILSGFCLLFGQTVSFAAPPVARSIAQRSFHDVSLSRGGKLHGAVASSNGVSLHGVPVRLYHAGKVAAETTSDSAGRFAFQQLRGGTYQLAVPGNSLPCRLWAAGTAPPVAKSQLLMTVPGQVVRGQFRPTRPYEWVETYPLLSTAIFAGLIAVPVAVIAANDGSSGS